MVTASQCPPSPDLSLSVGAYIVEGIERVLALLRQKVGGVDDSTGSVKDLAFLEFVAARIKDMQSRYNLKEQGAKEQCEKAGLAGEQLRRKGNELLDWYNHQIHFLKREFEMLSMDKEDVAARETRLAECKARLDAKEVEISSRGEALKLTFCNKKEELEARICNAPRS
ncbi:hypothetical protein D1007_52564 [Hordeum vulgare]|nr:hypothetical protein D1007_52564 [Hordeum vulgare]